MSEPKEELKKEIIEHSAKAFKLFEEAKQIQQLVFNLPLSERKAVMSKVRTLEKEAVEEAQKSIELERMLAAS